LSGNHAAGGSAHQPAITGRGATQAPARRRQARPGKGAQTKQGNPLQEGSNKYRAKQKKHKPKNA